MQFLVQHAENLARIEPQLLPHHLVGIQGHIQLSLGIIILEQIPVVTNFVDVQHRHILEKTSIQSIK